MAASAAASVPLWNGLKSENVVSSASDEWRDLRRGLASVTSSRGAGGAKLVRGLRTDGGGNASLEDEGSWMTGGAGLIDLRRALGGGRGGCSAGGGVLFLGVVICTSTSCLAFLDRGLGGASESSSAISACVTRRRDARGFFSLTTSLTSGSSTAGSGSGSGAGAGLAAILRDRGFLGGGASCPSASTSSLATVADDFLTRALARLTPVGGGDSLATSTGDSSPVLLTAMIPRAEGRTRASAARISAARDWTWFSKSATRSAFLAELGNLTECSTRMDLFCQPGIFRGPRGGWMTPE